MEDLARGNWLTTHLRLIDFIVGLMGVKFLQKYHSNTKVLNLRRVVWMWWLLQFREEQKL